MLDDLDEVLVDVLLGLLGIDPHQLSLVLLLDQGLEALVLDQLLLDVRVLVLNVVHKTIQDCLVCQVLVEDVVVFVSDRVEPPLLKLLVDQVLGHVQGDEDVGLLVLEFLKLVDLLD